MNIDFRCAHCGKLLSASGQTGESVRCPHCQKITDIPAGLASLPRPQVPTQASPPPLATVPPPVAAASTAAAMEAGSAMGMLERMMPFVISVFFHLGLGLVFMFVGTMLIVKEPKARDIPVPGITYTSEGSDNPYAPRNLPNQTYGTGQGSAVPKITNASARDAAISAGAGSGSARPGQPMIGMMGAVGGTGAGGTGVGKGKGYFGTGGGGGGPRFFGVPGRGRQEWGGNSHHIVYVVDRSGSMLDTFDAVKNEMLTSIGRLEPNQHDFHTILFAGSDQPIEMNDKRLVPASIAYQAAAAEFLKDKFPGGQTNPVPAIVRAFDVLDGADKRPGKIIFLLTDAGFPDNDKVLALIRSRNARKDVAIFTFLYGNPPPEAIKTMETIARENGGRFHLESPEEN